MCKRPHLVRCVHSTRTGRKSKFCGLLSVRARVTGAHVAVEPPKAHKSDAFSDPSRERHHIAQKMLVSTLKPKDYSDPFAVATAFEMRVHKFVERTQKNHRFSLLCQDISVNDVNSAHMCWFRRTVLLYDLI